MAASPTHPTTAMTSPAPNAMFRKPLPGTSLDWYDARAAVEALRPGAWAGLPYTARVHAENIVRKADPTMRDAYLAQLVERRRDLDFPWFPARVVCHDILGQTALVDLAGLRDAIADQGGDPARVNPVVPVQLIVDHSLAVEAPGSDPEAFRKNREIEDRRNADRFHFIEWTKHAFANVDVIPAGNGIMHQINLEKMSPVVYVQDGVAFPDTCVGTDSHTPHVDALGVIAIGVGGLEAENVMLGRASWMRTPDIVAVELDGRPRPGITATDVVLALTEFLRKEKVVGAYLEFRGEGAAALTIGDRATISNMAPEYGATAAMFAIDDNTLDYLRLTGRDDAQVRLVETYAKASGLWAADLADARYERTLRFDLSGVVRNMAGPSNPHRRLPVDDLAARVGPVQQEVESERGFYQIEELETLAQAALPEVYRSAEGAPSSQSQRVSADPRERLLAGTIERVPEYAHVLVDAVAVAGPSRAICVLDRRRGPGPVVVARPRGSCRRARAGLGWAGLSPLPHDDQLSQCSRDFRLCSRDDPPFRARRGYPRRGARIGGSSGRGGPRRRCPQRRGARGRRARGAGRGHDRGDHPGPVCRAAG